MRVLICGSRDWADREAVEVVLNGLTWTRDDSLVVIAGGARGADRLAADWARCRVDDEVDLVEFPADWDAHGKAAGHIRNQQMLDEGKPDVVWAFKSRPSSPGTDNMIQRAKAAGVNVYVVIRP